MTWGAPVPELVRRIDQTGPADAGVRAEVLGQTGGEARVLLFAANGDRLDWAEALVRARLGDVVLGGDGTTLKDASSS